MIYIKLLGYKHSTVSCNSWFVNIYFNIYFRIIKTFEVSGLDSSYPSLRSSNIGSMSGSSMLSSNKISCSGSGFLGITPGFLAISTCSTNEPLSFRLGSYRSSSLAL